MHQTTCSIDAFRTIDIVVAPQCIVSLAQKGFLLLDTRISESKVQGNYLHSLENCCCGRQQVATQGEAQFGLAARRNAGGGHAGGPLGGLPAAWRLPFARGCGWLRGRAGADGLSVAHAVLAGLPAGQHTCPMFFTTNFQLCALREVNLLRACRCLPSHSVPIQEQIFYLLGSASNVCRVSGWGACPPGVAGATAGMGVSPKCMSCT
jgi:hypothetical protein